MAPAPPTGQRRSDRALRWAAPGAIAFFVLAPGTVAGVVPYTLTRWRTAAVWPGPVRALGAIAGVFGLLSLLESFGRFVVRGRGTPAPVAPPDRLVVSGQYRYVRNPMYLAVLAIIAAQALVFGSTHLLWYALGVFLVVHVFVVLYEEPTLGAQFGESYAEYCRSVRRWVPGRRYDGRPSGRIA